MTNAMCEMAPQSSERSRITYQIFPLGSAVRFATRPRIFAATAVAFASTSPWTSRTDTRDQCGARSMAHRLGNGRCIGCLFSGIRSKKMWEPLGNATWILCSSLVWSTWSHVLAGCFAMFLFGKNYIESKWPFQCGWPFKCFTVNHPIRLSSWWFRI